MDREYSAWYYNYNEILKGDDCEGVNRGALIELLFFEKTGDKELRPYPIDDFWMVQKDNVMECQINNGSEEKFSKLLLIATDNCSCAARVNTTYTIKRLGRHDNLNYSLQIPKSEELVFQEEFNKISGPRGNSVYKMPILLGDVLKTKEAPKDFKKNIQFIITGINSSTRKGRKQVYVYMKEGSVLANGEVSRNQKFTFDVKARDSAAVVGGDLALFHEMTASFYRSNNLSREDVWPYTLQTYKRNIQSRKVDLSKKLAFDHERHEWMKRTLNLDSIFQEFSYDVSNEVLNSLKKNRAYLFTHGSDQPGNLPSGVRVTEGILFGENGTRKTTLSAPSGVYDLKISHFTVIEGLEWPPADKKLKPNVQTD